MLYYVGPCCVGVCVLYGRVVYCVCTVDVVWFGDVWTGAVLVCVVMVRDVCAGTMMWGCYVMLFMLWYVTLRCVIVGCGVSWCFVCLSVYGALCVVWVELNWWYCV